MTLAMQELLRRQQGAAEKVRDKMLAMMIGYEPCRTLRIEDAKFIAEMARTYAFDAMKDAPAAERKVVVRAQAKDAGIVEISVRDRGTGLTGDSLSKIFQPFYTTKREGLGMGLPISRSILEAHGGRLWAKNNLDRGATFYFTVPAISGAASLAAIVDR